MTSKMARCRSVSGESASEVFVSAPSDAVGVDSSSDRRVPSLMGLNLASHDRKIKHVFELKLWLNRDRGSSDGRLPCS